MLFFLSLSAVAFVSCYEWQEKAYVSLDCGSEMIKINSVKHGLSQMPRESFCQSPVVDPVTDCFDTYNETEVAMFRGCNVMSSCNISIPFLSLQSKCNVGDGEGSKYVVVDYECVPSKFIFLCRVTKCEISPMYLKFVNERTLFYSLDSSTILHTLLIFMTT